MPSQTAFEFCLLALGLRIQDMSEIRKRSWMTFGTVNSEGRIIKICSNESLAHSYTKTGIQEYSITVR